MRALRQLSARLRLRRVPTQRFEPGDLEVLLALPAWSVVRSTDRDYIYDRFAQINQHFKVRFHANHGLRSLALANMQSTLERFAPQLSLPGLEQGSVQALRVAPSMEVIFAYGDFPKGLESHVPILWEHTFAPQRGIPEAVWVQQLRAAHLRAATEATRVVTATDVSVDWFRKVFPEFADKITAIPYYLPHLSLPESSALEKKAADSGKLRVVFVGKEARRKGLDSLVAAWQLLDADTQGKLSFDVVTGMYDGPVELPADWKLHDSVPDVMVLMRDAHVLAFPTKHKAYGLVLVEGLSAGCAILTTSAEIQRSIVGPAAGKFVDPTSAAQIADALKQWVSDRAALRANMFAARERFAECYQPNVVGARYAQLLWDTAGRKVDKVARD